MKDELTIGRLASTAGVNIETIRIYQQRGLLGKPYKPQGGHLRYPAEAAKRLRFIKRAQRLGFTLTQVSGLLGLEQAPATADTRKRAERKLTLIEQKIADLAEMQQVLAGLVQQCDKGSRGARCPIVDVLARN